MVGAAVFADGIEGKIDASAILKPSMPLTCNSAFTTALSSTPIRQLPHK